MAASQRPPRLGHCLDLMYVVNFMEVKLKLYEPERDMNLTLSLSTYEPGI